MISPFKRIFLYIKLIWYHFVFYTTPTLEENHYANIGTVCFELEKYRKAISCFNKSEKAHSGKEHSLTKYNSYYIGYSYLNLGNHIKAANNFEKYLALVPGDTEIRTFVGWCYLLQNKHEVALRIYTRLIELEPDLPIHRIESAKILFELGRKDEAYQQLEDANKVSNNDGALKRLITGIKYKFDGDLKNAVDEMKQAIKCAIEMKSGLYSQLDDLYILLSDLYRETGDRAGTIAVLENLYEMNSNDLWNANCLAFEYAEQEVKLKKALKLINRCLMYQPENSYFLDTKGWILFKMGDVEEAKRLISTSLNLNPHAKDTNKHYKMITGSSFVAV